MPNPHLFIDYQNTKYNTSLDTHEVGFTFNFTHECSTLKVDTFSRRDIITNNLRNPMSSMTFKERLAIIPSDDQSLVGTEDNLYHRITVVTSEGDLCSSEESYFSFQQRGTGNRV